MKKWFIFILWFCLFCNVKHGYGQYQLPNGNFNAWNGSIPVGWSTFSEANCTLGSLMCGVAQGNHHSKEDGRSGLSGDYCIKVYSQSTFGITANGMMTCGRVNMGSSNAADASNHTYTDKSGTKKTAFSGTPDSVYFWTKYTAKTSTDKARFSVYFHGDNSFRDPNDGSNKSMYRGKALLDFLPSNTWVQKQIPVIYDGNSSVNYCLITFASNNTAGGGNDNDAVYIDDIEMIYSAWLTDIKMDGTTIAGFQIDKFNYYKEFPRGTNPYDTSLLPNITYTSEVSDVTISDTTIYGANYSIDSAKRIITVTAEDGVTIKTYTIHYNVQKSSDNTLNSFTYSFNGLSLTENVLQDTTTIILPPGTTQVPTITTCVLADTGARYMVTPALQVQGGISIISVRAENGNIKNYYIKFIVQLSSNADLSAIYYNGTSVANFHKDTLFYRVILAPGTTLSPHITATTAWAGLQPSISQASTLQDTAKIIVTAEDGITQKTYFITFVVALSTNTKLANIKYNNIIVSPFNADSLNFTVEIPKNMQQVVVAATPEWATAQVNIVQPTQIPGIATIEVIAEDSNYSQIYTVNFVYQKNNNARLSFIKYNIGFGDSLVENFNPSYLQYIITLPEGTTTIPTITALPQDTNATMIVSSISSPDDTATIQVTAEDGKTTLNYVIIFKVYRSIVATLDSIWIDSLPIKNFSANVLTYNIELDSIYMPQIKAFVSHSKAKVKILYPQTIPGQVQIIVVAEDTTISKIYRINLSQPTSNNADLLDLSYQLNQQNCVINNFNPDTLIYHIKLLSQTVDIPVIYCQSADFSAQVTIRQPDSPNGVGVVLVMSSDLSVYKLYQIFFDVEISDNANLAGLYYEFPEAMQADTITVNGNDSTTWISVPNFHPDSLTYLVELPYNWSETQIPNILFSPQSSAAQTYITPAKSIYDSAIIVVFAENRQIVNRYVIHFNRQLSPIATLDNITYRLGNQDSIVQNFASHIFDYKVDIAAEMLSIPEVFYSLTDKRAKAYFNRIPMQRNDTAEIVVVAENQIDSNIYRIVFHYLASSNTQLQFIVVNGDTLETFQADTLEYNIILPWEENNVPAIVAASQWQYANIDITSAASIPGYTQIRVVAEDNQTQRIYTLHFHRGSNVDLLSLNYTINGITDSISGFNSQDTIYHVLLPIGTTTIPTIGYTLVDNRCSITEKQPLLPNDTAIITLVGWDNLNKKTYQIIFEVELSTEAKLADLQVDGSTIDKFHSDSLHYFVEYSYGHNVFPSISAIATQPDARIVIDSIYQYPQQVEIIVYAGDTNIFTTYTIDFSVEAGDNNYLSEILVNGIALANFDKNVNNYQVELPYGTDSIAFVAATAEDSRANVLIQQADSITGMATITVLAINGDSNQYQLQFYLGKNSDATLQMIFVEETPLEGFDPQRMGYRYNVYSSYEGIPTVQAISSDSNATITIVDATAIPGATTITVVAENQKDSLIYRINFIKTTSIAEIKNKTSKVYPNPCYDKFIIEVSDDIIGSNILIYTIEGKEILNKTINQSQTEISIHNLASGVYIYRIVNIKDILKTGKLIKQ